MLAPMRTFPTGQQLLKNTTVRYLVAFGLGTALTAGCCIGPPQTCGPRAKQQHGEVAARKADGRAPDGLVCGPRCVQYLLHYYGQDTDLIELVARFRWPDLERGASLDNIDRALRQRGVYTYAMQLTPQARLKWSYPVLVHLKVDGTTTGHYAVRLPSSSGEADVWYGLPGIRRLSDSLLAERWTGAVLLTAPEPITSPALAVERAGTSARDWLSCVGGLVCFVLIVGVARKHSQRHSWFHVQFFLLGEKK